MSSANFSINSGLSPLFQMEFAKQASATPSSTVGQDLQALGLPSDIISLSGSSLSSILSETPDQVASSGTNVSSSLSSFVTSLSSSQLDELGSAVIGIVTSSETALKAGSSGLLSSSDLSSITPAGWALFNDATKNGIAQAINDALNSSTFDATAGIGGGQNTTSTDTTPSTTTTPSSPTGKGGAQALKQTSVPTATTPSGPAATPTLPQSSGTASSVYVAPGGSFISSALGKAADPSSIIAQYYNGAPNSPNGDSTNVNKQAVVSSIFNSVESNWGPNGAIDQTVQKTFDSDSNAPGSANAFMKELGIDPTNMSGAQKYATYEVAKMAVETGGNFDPLKAPSPDGSVGGLSLLGGGSIAQSSPEEANYQGSGSDYLAAWNADFNGGPPATQQQQEELNLAIDPNYMAITDSGDLGSTLNSTGGNVDQALQAFMGGDMSYNDELYGQYGMVNGLKSVGLIPT